ncbi:MAG TPA: FAD-binding oxidoreductase [Candidatus Dormibacteraeota bacterium]|nr:FAD-binding oxidoreductase [Candidatus Dormibacteraeota bacterium]
MPRPELGLPAGVDVLIIGAGAVGCSLAYSLAERGVKSVLVVDRGGIGEGSTGRCAGGVRQQFSTEVNVRIGMLSRSILENFEERLGRSADFRQIGYLFVAPDDTDMSELRRNLDVQHRAGLADSREVDVEEIGRLVPGLRTDDLRGGSYCPTDGIAGPNEVTFGYAHSARQKGVRIMEGVEVLAIKVKPGDCRVRTSRGAIRAGLVVCCAGAWSAEVGRMVEVDVPVVPYRRHIFVTGPFDGATRETPMTVDYHTTFYFHPEGDGLLLGMSDPAEPPSYRTDVDWDFLDHMVEHAVARFPALEQARVQTGWAGLYEVTPDHQPLIGEMPARPGLWMCTGFSGHGFMQAPAVGELCGDLIVGREPAFDISALRPGRFAEGDFVEERAVI